MPDEKYLKEYAAKLAKESSQELLKKSTVNNITPTTIIIKKIHPLTTQPTTSYAQKISEILV